MRWYRGFTLIELLITIVIGVILLMVGLPAMRQFIVSSAVELESSSLYNAIHSARSQAIALNQDVVICYANTSNTCVTTGINHLLMFVDKDKNGSLTTGNADPDIVLLTGGTINSSIVIGTTQSNYRFTQEGVLRSSGILTLYNNDYSCTARKIIASLSGKAQLCDNNKAGVGSCPTGRYCP